MSRLVFLLATLLATSAIAQDTVAERQLAMGLTAADALAPDVVVPLDGRPSFVFCGGALAARFDACEIKPDSPFLTPLPAGTPLFIDPVVSIGFDYRVEVGPTVRSAWFEDVGDADGYAVLGWDGAAYTVALGPVASETWFDFGVAGVARFAVRGIDPAVGLDPADPTAFVTGLIFTDTLTGFALLMTPVVAGIPEPTAWTLMIAGFGLIGTVARGRRTDNRFARRTA